MAEAFLRPGKEKAALRHHPWVFGGAIDRIDGPVEDGDIITVRDARGGFVGRGYLNRRSQIVVRLLTWDEEEPIDSLFWARRITAAVNRRQELAADPKTTAYRLIHAEADLLPGLVVDRYDDYLVVQCLTLGIARRQQEILAALLQATAPTGIYERSDADVRDREGLPVATGVWWGADPPAELEILENDLRFLVDIRAGQKTGFYLDQRANRQALTRYAAGKEILDAFAYSGAFAVYAAAAGAVAIEALDGSAQALALARRNLALNNLIRPADACVEGDVFQTLRQYRDRRRTFDLIVLDPPRFAPTRQHVPHAARAYKDINLLAMKLLRPGGMLFTFSCSGGVDAALFQRIVFGASIDAHREVQILESLSQGPDHPILLSFPESAYLKGLACRVL